MKNLSAFMVFSIALLISFSCTENPKPELSEQIKNDLRQDAKQFMGSLKTVLVKEMQTNGILAAVSACSDTAQILTQSYSTDKGIYIKRVSFKNRNPNNIPDEFEAKALKYFEDLKANNKLDEATEFFEVVETEEVKTVRYMKPILIQAPCLNCHGADENISPDVRAIIDNKYPEDKATGYQLDELRGAVSLSKRI